MCALLALLFSLPLTPTRAQQTNWVPCDQNGNVYPWTWPDSAGFYPMVAAMTGSGCGSQSLPLSQPYGYQYSPNPIAFDAWLVPSGSHTFSGFNYGDDDSYDIGASGWNGGFGSSACTSSGQADAAYTWSGYFLWRGAGAPPSQDFLVQSTVGASTSSGYWRSVGGNPVPSAGLSVSASASDQFGDQNSSAYSGGVAPLPSAGFSDCGHPGVGPYYHLVRGQLTQLASGAWVASVTLSGQAHVQASNQVDATIGVGYIEAGASIYGQAKPASIHLSSPDPAIHPETGNDPHRQNNQFVYGGQQSAYAPDPSSPYSDSHNLFIPVTITFNGASTSDMQWLQSHINVSITPTIPNAVPFTYVVNGNQISLQSTYCVFNIAFPDFGETVTYNGFVATGLPGQNSDFGNHQVTLTVDGQVADVANIQTFFSPLDATHPVSADPNTWLDEANFFFYYDQVHPTTGTYASNPIPDVTHTDLLPPFDIHMTNDAYSGYGLPIFDNGPVSTNPGMVRWVGDLTIPNGILAWVHTCAHEGSHQRLLQQGGIYTFPQVLNIYSQDGDDVYDVWEAQHGMDPTKADSTGAYRAAQDAGDDELLADVAAFPAVFANTSLWNQDWSSTGLQYGFLGNISSPADNLFQFDPQVAGVGISASGAGEYYFKTLNDVLTAYPGAIVIGDLPLLNP